MPKASNGRPSLVQPMSREVTQKTFSNLNERNDIDNVDEVTLKTLNSFQLRSDALKILQQDSSKDIALTG